MAKKNVSRETPKQKEWRLLQQRITRLLKQGYTQNVDFEYKKLTAKQIKALRGSNLKSYFDEPITYEDDVTSGFTDTNTPFEELGYEEIPTETFMTVDDAQTIIDYVEMQLANLPSKVVVIPSNGGPRYYIDVLKETPIMDVFERNKETMGINAYAKALEPRLNELAQYTDFEKPYIYEEELKIKTNNILAIINVVPLTLEDYINNNDYSETL